MKTYRLMFKGNDIFTSSHTVKTKDFAEAASKALLDLDAISKLTIEQVRVVGVREENDLKYQQ